MTSRGLATLLPLALLCAAALPAQQQQDTPILTGVITRLASPTDFDVNGLPVQISPHALLQLQGYADHDSFFSTVPSPADLHLFLGQPLVLYGTRAHNPDRIQADRITTVAGKPATIEGSAVIDAMLPLPAGARVSDTLLRADGYPIHLTARTKRRYTRPLASPADIHPNTWITYEGTQQPDGSILASKALFSPNTISRYEDKVREHWEYDPAAVASDSRQDALSKAIVGIDPKEIPPYKDDAMQARVDAVAAKLIPPYQISFPETEPTRIDFRFHLIDNPRWPYAWTLPNGIILLPHQAVERMGNDSQLAALLADSIACALEKQPLHTFGPVAETSAIAAGLVLAGATGGLGTWAGVHYIGSRAERLREEQSGRVSLALMHQAGYDILQAPRAWQLLAAKDPTTASDTSLPYRSVYLYSVIGQVWPQVAHAASPALPSAATLTPPAQP